MKKVCRHLEFDGVSTHYCGSIDRCNFKIKKISGYNSMPVYYCNSKQEHKRVLELTKKGVRI